MKRAHLLITLLLAPLISVAQAAKIKMPDFSELSKKAKESVDISLDGEMLKTAAGFMSNGRNVNDADLAAVMRGLDGVYVKVFSFGQPNMYSTQDISSVVRQVESQGWKKLLSAKDQKSQVQMWMRDNSSDGGMFLVVSEPNELVMINLVGKVDLETLRKLQGSMGIPSVPGLNGGGAPPAPSAPAAPKSPPEGAR